MSWVWDQIPGKRQHWDMAEVHLSAQPSDALGLRVLQLIFVLMSSTWRERAWGLRKTFLGATSRSAGVRHHCYQPELSPCSLQGILGSAAYRELQMAGNGHSVSPLPQWYSSGTVLSFVVFLKSRAHAGVNGRAVWPGTAFQFIETLSCPLCSWRRTTLKQAWSAVRSFPSTHVFYTKGSDSWNKSSCF